MIQWCVLFVLLPFWCNPQWVRPCIRCDRAVSNQNFARGPTRQNERQNKIITKTDKEREGKDRRGRAVIGWSVTAAWLEAKAVLCFIRMGCYVLRI